MVAYIPLRFALCDAFYALGLGLALSAVYSMARLLLPNNKVVVFVLDIGIFVLSAILYSSTASTRFYAGIPRWYTMAALLLGYFAWRICVNPSLFAIAHTIYNLLILPFTLCKKYLLSPLLLLIKKKIVALNAKKRSQDKKSHIKNVKQLQKPLQVLYNSN
ncbi:MAG: spore cortex biosynthesis protein YabQ [Oscillospiraceae bacterium]